MNTVIVFDRHALAQFRADHPWLHLSDDVIEVSLYLDDNGAPLRLVGKRLNGDLLDEVDCDRLPAATAFAIVRCAPALGKARAWTPAGEQDVWRILQELFDTPFDATGHASAANKVRNDLLDQGYRIARQLTLEVLNSRAIKTEEPAERLRLCRAAGSVPRSLAEVGEAHRPLFMEADTWRMVAVLRDELLLTGSKGHLTAVSTPTIGRRDIPAGLQKVIDETLFDTAPIAFSVSTTGYQDSRFIRVNQSYLDLVGRSWAELDGCKMLESGVAVDSPGRKRRLELLQQQGGYSSERAEIRVAGGGVLPVLISAKRLVVSGEAYDLEAISAIRGDTRVSLGSGNVVRLLQPAS
ncbi:PAS domain-containing protein [Ciceribacter sp. RN22]|uniref:PAS domain-containing protein n=1 Tax=Ciceribacter sp. RN22 TaxID=2954932 RepID=UPI00209256A2|nr:PAS domain-containing protein [Ciceribacter sp. RN22]MCO6180554.1 PAS domain-containing protein [Ciceribacter sp. RN22]